jgi:hypothetical protein
MGLLESINQNTGIITTIFTVVVGFATVAYAFLTWSLVSETKRMIEVQTEPKVSAIIQPNEANLNLIDLIVQNIRLGPAYDLEFELNHDFEDRWVNYPR